MASSPQQQAIEARQTAADTGDELWSDDKTVTTAGNSAAITISPEELSVLGAEVGDEVSTSISEDGFVIEPVEE